MPAPYPTLTISQFISPAESRGLWLSLYAAAFARGLPILESLDVATRGVIALSASVLANDPALPTWLKTYDDEAEEVPNAVAPENASARAEGSGGATPRERAIEALHREVLSTDQHGCERNCAEVAVDAIEGAGLRIVDAREDDERQDALALARLALVTIRGHVARPSDVCLEHIAHVLDVFFRSPAARVPCAQDYPAAPGSRSGTHASGDAADDGRGEDGGAVIPAQTVDPAASSPRAPGDASPAREGTTDRCPECRTTSAHKLDCSRGRRRYTGPAKGL